MLAAMSRVVRSLAKAALLAAALGALAAPASAQEMTQARFGAVMDRVFGPGTWRMTGGYRTPEREDQLRAQGAMTVRPGGMSRHSLGHPGAPGAFDLVVNGMSPFTAAQRLRDAGAPFAKYQPKGTHGTQGPHLHLEPYGFGPVGQPRFQVASATTAKVEEGRARSVTLMMPQPSASSAAAMLEELARLQADAREQDPEAQLELGRIYTLGYVAPRDFETARKWLEAAARNPLADPDTRASAEAGVAEVTTLIEAERAQLPTQVARLRTGAADR